MERRQQICPYCSTEAKWLFRASDINNRVSDAGFDYFECAACHLVFIGSIPSDLGRYYSRDYAPYQRPATRQDLQKQLDPVRFRIDLVKRFKKGGSLLEIGPSYGAFSLLAKESGFDVSVIEMDASCCDFIQRELKIPAIQSSNVGESLRSSGRSFDVIALWHNIEHVPEAWTMLKDLSQHLNPGGIIIFSTPNPEALQFRVLKRFWNHLDAPRHLYLMPIDFVQKVFQGPQLKQLLFTSADNDSAQLTRHGWSSSLKGLAGKNPLKMLLARIGGRLLSLLFGSFEKERHAAAYTAVFTKT
jgi:2-polyprenyl-3-methyl-5-hydroxy-6-metoxy-1,4-benzoquinol methylase